MMKLFYSSALIMSVCLSGCIGFHSPAEEPSAEVYIGLNSSLITNARVVVDRISVNGTLPPDDAWNHTITKLRQNTQGKLEIHDIVHLNLPTDQNGYLKEQSEISLQETGPYQITFIFIPKMKRSSRAVCSTLYNNEKERKILRNVIRCDAYKINNTSLPFVTTERVWTFVLLHEVGHALGTPADLSHIWEGSHCTNSTCVMYPKLNLRSVLAFFFHGVPDDFCKDCRAELQNAKNSANQRMNPMR